VLLGCTALATVMFAGSAMADDTSAPETVVVTGTRFNTDAAPAKASLDTTEPQTIINRSYIENFVPPGSDYVTILAIVPGLTGGDINGPGLSDGGTKNTLRGFGDGNFNMTYDGIPFGDTNGPTHHNISYFPASTIGSIDVDRGPGNAGNIGSNTYGGTIKLYSEGLTDDPHAKALASYGSFNTELGIVNGQTGDWNTDGFGTIRAMANLQYQHSDGALSGQDLYTHNELVKVQDELNAHWTITLFANQSFLKENLSDNDGATPAQVAVYGKDFALQNTNPALPTYAPYNYTSKHTDMDYARIDGDLFGGIKLENTAYTYAYWNHTFSPAAQTQTLADINAGVSQGNWTATLPNGETANGLLTPVNGPAPANGILAYTKENAYRTYGDILRLSEDYDFGWIDGQVRAGMWWETQATHRFRYYYSQTECAADGIDPFDIGDAASNAACGTNYKKKTVLNGALGYTSYDEHSDWTQYEPFVEVDIKALSDRLTITPGLKYIHWDRGVNAPVEAKNLCGIGTGDNNTVASTGCTNAPGQNYTAGYITRDLLPFLEMNYKLEPSWSMYFEFAKGIYIPDISTFENSHPTNVFPAAETTTNYQFGTVYYADQFTFDADVYYIPIHNNYVAVTCPAPNNSDECYDNTGSAVYQGLEGEGTYAFDTLFGHDVHGLSVFANGALMSSKSGGLWVPSAPMWTAAAGILFQTSQWKFGLIDKQVGPQYSDATDNKYYELHTYGNLTATAGYTYECPGVGAFELSANVDNLLDSRKDTLITENGFVGNAPAGTKNPDVWQNSLDQYFFQAPRSVFVNLTYRY
jgi:iron complex outermembrane receptor protein